MNGIVINIDPVILQIGGIELRWYSVAVMAAVATAVIIIAHEGRRKGIPPAEIYSLALWAVLAGILGARLFHVVDHFSYYMQHPSRILQFQGLAIWGALGGGGLAAVVYAKVRGIPLGRLFDAAAPALLAAQMIGRLGCIVNGDAYGGVTGLPWGFIYTHPEAMIPRALLGVPTHPYPLYELLWNGGVLVVILALRRSLKVDGALFLIYVSLYAVARFLLTFVRQESEVLWVLQQAQILAIAVFFASLAMLAYLWRRSHAGSREGGPDGVDAASSEASR